MRYVSVCSGIEAATVAWHPLGCTPVAFSEIEPFPSALLAHHYPQVPNYGDMTKFQEWPIEPGTVDLLVGGTPCQSFSVAGLRKGISDPRGGLMLTYLEIARRFRPRWVVWENVPGVLSSGGGRDFGSFLGALGELGYGWAYRVLDAQWVRTHRHPRAVPQRRRRVFVVGCLRDWDRAAQVLFERESVQRDSAKGRATRKGTTADAQAGVGAGCVTSHDVAPCLETTCHDYSRADGFTMVAGTLGNRGLRSHTELDGHGAYVPVAFGIYGGNKRQDRPEGGFYVREEDTARTLDAAQGLNPTCSQGGTCITQPVPYDLFQITAPVNRQNRKPGDPCHTLARDNAAHAAVVGTDCYNGAITGDVAATIGTPGSSVNASGPTVMAFHPLQDPVSSTDGSTHCMGTGGSQGHASIAVACPTLTAHNDPSRSPQSSEVTQQVAAVHAASMTVRRLTPRECERLQAFPDDYTLIPWRGKGADQCPDGPRYKALGNSMAVNCMAWIGERIAAVDSRHDL